MQKSRRVCLLTGASGTLGEAFCRRFAGQYAIIGVYCHNYPKIATTEQVVVDPLDPKSHHPENEYPIIAHRADLMRDKDLLALVDFCVSRLDPVDVVVNAAGYSRWSPILSGDTVLASILPQLYLNAVVPLKLSTLLARRSWQNCIDENRRAGRTVVNISSTAALNLYKGLGQSAYAASKSALNTLTLHMAAEFEQIGVKVSAVAPNTFSTIVPLDAVLSEIERLIEEPLSGVIRVID